jgi:hypothetical protein
VSDPRDSATFRALRFSIGIAVTGLVVSLVMAGGSWWLWEREKKLAVTSKRDESGVRSRLDSIRRERDDLLGSEDTYRMLAARGIFLPEKRLDFIEAMETLKSRHKLVSLEYDLFPQRALKFGTGLNYGATDIRASRLKVKVKAIHDGALVAFFDDIRRIERGFFPFDRCVLKRSQGREIAVALPAPGSPGALAAPRLPTALPAAVDDGDAPAPSSTTAEPDTSIGAECALEWITIVDKAPQNTAQAGAERPKS